MRAVGLFLLGLAACGSVSNGKPDAFVPPIDAPALTSISVTGTNVTSLAQPPLQLTATGTYGDGSMKDITTTVTWTSSDTTIATVAAGLVTPVGVGTTTITAALDGKNNILNVAVNKPTLVVSNFANNTLVFLPVDATGAATALRTIAGAVNTKLSSPRGVTVVNNEVYVANQGGASVTVYSVNDSGDVVPTRIITGPTTMLASPADVEVFNNEVYVGLLSGLVLVFPADANGDVAPTRTITSGATRATGLKFFNNELYIEDLVGASLGQGEIYVVPPTSSGTVTPTRTITSASFDGPQDLEISGGEIYTANDYNSSITVFPVAANGATTPTRTLTGLHTPDGLLVYNGELYTTNESPAAIQVYPTSATGAAAPTRTITNASFSSSIGIALY